MALSSVYITAPTAAAAAAMGLYFFGRNHPNNHEGGRGASAASFVAREKKINGMSIVTQPKLAPQFDGLFCFETIVGH